MSAEVMSYYSYLTKFNDNEILIVLQSLLTKQKRHTSKFDVDVLLTVDTLCCQYK